MYDFLNRRGYETAAKRNSLEYLGPKSYDYLNSDWSSGKLDDLTFDDIFNTI